jgi:hypothetical protein
MPRAAPEDAKVPRLDVAEKHIGFVLMPRLRRFRPFARTQSIGSRRPYAARGAGSVMKNKALGQSLALIRASCLCKIMAYEVERQNSSKTSICAACCRLWKSEFIDILLCSRQENPQK